MHLWIDLTRCQLALVLGCAACGAYMWPLFGGKGVVDDHPQPMLVHAKGAP
jgi:hypothetical protein